MSEVMPNETYEPDDCREVRQWLAFESTQEPLASERLHDHLQGCASCRSLVAGHQQAEAALQRWKDWADSQAFAAGTRAWHKPWLAAQRGPAVEPQPIGSLDQEGAMPRSGSDSSRSAKTVIAWLVTAAAVVFAIVTVSLEGRAERTRTLADLDCAPLLPVSRQSLSAQEWGTLQELMAQGRGCPDAKPDGEPVPPHGSAVDAAGGLGTADCCQTCHQTHARAPSHEAHAMAQACLVCHRVVASQPARSSFCRDAGCWDCHQLAVN